MKFLSVPALEKISTTLSGFDLGDRIIHGRVEAYSCKATNTDKRLSKQLERQLSAELSADLIPAPASPPLQGFGTPPIGSPHLQLNGSSSSASGQSPLGRLGDSNTRKLLLSLITTMNQAFQDYDFSNLRPEQFDREPDAQTAMTTLNNLFVESIDQQSPGFRSEFWKSIDDNIELDKCEVYLFNPDPDSDIGKGKLWSMNYFFFNKKQKKIVFTSAHAVSKLHGDADVCETDDSSLHHDMSSSSDEEDNPAGETGGAYIDVNLLAWDQNETDLDSETSNTQLESVISTNTSLSPFIAGVSIDPNSLIDDVAHSPFTLDAHGNLATTNGTTQVSMSHYNTTNISPTNGSNKRSTRS